MSTTRANYRLRELTGMDRPHTWRSLYCTASLLIQTLTSDTRLKSLILYVRMVIIRPVERLWLWQNHRGGTGPQGLLLLQLQSRWESGAIAATRCHTQTNDGRAGRLPDEGVRLTFDRHVAGGSAAAAAAGQ